MVQGSEVAKRITDAAAKHGGSFFINELPKADLVFALDKKWVTPVGVGDFQITEALPG